MTATNHTSNYSLSQFQATDRPTWQGDYNGDMSKNRCRHPQYRLVGRIT